MSKPESLRGKESCLCWAVVDGEAVPVWYDCGGIFLRFGSNKFYDFEDIESVELIPDVNSLQSKVLIDKECNWKSLEDEHMPGSYSTGCGEVWTFNEGSLTDNECEYCFKCGGKIADTALSTAIQRVKT